MSDPFAGTWALNRSCSRFDANHRAMKSDKD
jgi:hypothetical protein